MDLIEINERPEFASKEKVNKKITCFSKLINELRKRQLSEKLKQIINHEILNINDSKSSEKEFLKTLAKSQAIVLREMEKDSKLVVKNHYRNLWMLLGMSAFGIPIGVAFGISIGNLGLLGLGFPIGMGIGVGVGSALDNKAAKEGRQLDVVFSV